MLLFPWRNSHSSLRRAAACCLVLVACCGEHRPVGALAESDATAEGAAPGGSSRDGTFAEGDEVADDAISGSSPDSGDSSLDGVASGLDPDASDEMSPGFVDADASPVEAMASGPTGPCNAITAPHPIEGFSHAAACSHVTYATKPPSSGDHYPSWAAYKSYASAIPEGFWVHNLEHGAVVLSYNCPGGCAADVAAAQTWIDGLPVDSQCSPSAGDPRVRVLMTPDTHLDVKFAASAWGWTLRADCFDPAAFGTFLQTHYSQGREVLCAQGVDFPMGTQDGCGE